MTSTQVVVNADGKDVEVTETWHEYLFRSEIGTNGLKGGDAGHGGRTYIKLDNVHESLGVVKVDGKQVASFPDSIELVFEGDLELYACIEVFEHAAKLLRKQAGIEK